ncbi:MAG: 50S ribosomal protein L17 [Patescibacteria group bacterium]|nr:50S ribosomal protein L17 [Patescibacteria group bacterium]
MKTKKKFHLKRDQRKALFKILLHNFIVNGKIKTTDERAKYLKRLVERLISRIKKDDELTGLRRALRILPKKSAYKLMYEIVPRYGERTGGYVRIVKLPFNRLKDKAKISLIEFV